MSSKALFVEGGVADTSKCRVANPQFVYYRVAARDDLGIGEGIWKKADHWIYCPGGHKFSFAHDTGEPFWLMNSFIYNEFPSSSMSIDQVTNE